MRLHFALFDTQWFLAKEKLFYLSPDVAVCNHGSYGATPKRVHRRQIDIQVSCEQQPDVWFRWSVILVAAESQPTLAALVQDQLGPHAIRHAAAGEVHQCGPR